MRPYVQLHQWLIISSHFNYCSSSASHEALHSFLLQHVLCPLFSFEVNTLHFHVSTCLLHTPPLLPTFFPPIPVSDFLAFNIWRMSQTVISGSKVFLLRHCPVPGSDQVLQMCVETELPVTSINDGWACHPSHTRSCNLFAWIGCFFFFLGPFFFFGSFEIYNNVSFFSIFLEEEVKLNCSVHGENIT